MTVREGGVHAWQWSSYGRFHRDRGSLLLHFVGVPLFVAGTLAALVQALQAQWFGAGVALVAAALGFGLQAIGHRREKVPPIPFEGPGDFVSRMFVEQFVTFPRFVLSGHWLRHVAGDFSKE